MQWLQQKLDRVLVKRFVDRSFKRMDGQWDADVGLAEARRLLSRSEFRRAFPLLNELKARHVRMRDIDLLRARCFQDAGHHVSAIESLKEELRYFPENEAAATLLASLSARLSKPPDPTSAPDVEFQKLYDAIRSHTMVGEARLFSLFKLAKEICAADLPGNFVECGVAAGGSSALLAVMIARNSKQTRRLFSFDTFAGMPETSSKDTHNGENAEMTGWGTGTCSAPESSLMELCRKLKVDGLVEPVKGLFGTTLPAWRNRIGPIAFLHMDGDWYSSTWDILRNLHDQVVSGGCIQIDDYGYWKGCRTAVREFEQKNGCKFQLTKIDETGVWLRK
jgi:hypothetical protein